MLMLTLLFIGECEYLTLNHCRGLSKMWISMPNILGHISQIEIANSSAYRYRRLLVVSF